MTCDGDDNGNSAVHGTLQLHKITQVATLTHEPDRDDVLSPLQQDGSSCGVYCLAVAEAVMRGCDAFLKQEMIPACALETIRLRMMADILRHPTQPDDRWIEICEIAKMVNKVFPTDAMKR